MSINVEPDNGTGEQKHSEPLITHGALDPTKAVQPSRWHVFARRRFHRDAAYQRWRERWH